MRILTVLRALALACLLSAAPLAFAQPLPADIEAAKLASKEWLELIDVQRYAEAWDSAAGAARATSQKAGFDQSTYTARVALGALKQRTFKSALPIQLPADKARGEYIAVEYASSFEALAATTETVLVAKDQNFAWKAFSYAVKRPEELGDAQVRLILRDRIDAAHRGVGIVVGLLDKSGQRVVAHGVTQREGGKPVDGDTLFEIGSVTKVFTGVLLSDAVERGEVKLDDPVSKYLPASVKPLRADGKDITLLQLATHTSGLPRLPSNMPMKDPENPYADYTVAQLYEYLNVFDHPGPVAPGPQYSNLGVGLLGHVLALRARMDYEKLLRTRVLEPLGMKDTAIALSAAQKARLATGHKATLFPAAAWDMPAFPGAGALRSTVNDLLKFAGAKGMQGPGWMVQPNGEYLMHDGATGGYNAFIGLDTKAKRAVVVLANSANPIADIGIHLLTKGAPLTVFDRYVGTYSLTSNFSLTMTREGARFFSQATNQQKLEIFAESETEFFLKDVSAWLTFSIDAKGEATHVTLHQNGNDVRGVRLGKPPD
jgi:D-alanyl-D-alanine-carboxypeptidase/D-alanyl-D-alanine-endopeptidase